MIARFAIVVVTLLTTSSAFAETLTAEAARRFVAGKLFAFNCFDGSRGAGRIYTDGSVIGNIQFRGAGPMKQVWLPAGTLRVQGESVCASLPGHPVRAVLQSRQDERPELPWFGLRFRLRLLRLHPSRERCRRHKRPPPTFGAGGAWDGRGFRRGVELILH